MKKKTAIILIAIVVVIAILVGGLYLWYTKETEEPEKPGENYEQEYVDEIDVSEKISPVAIRMANQTKELRFAQLNQAELPSKQSKSLSEVMNGAPGNTVREKELDKMLGTQSTNLFKEYSKMFIHKRKVGNTASGYDFKVTRQNGLYEEMYFLITHGDLSKEFRKSSLAANTMAWDKGVSTNITYSHGTRKILKTGTTVNQYTFDVWIQKKDISYYLQIHFSGFNGELKEIHLTGTEAAARVAEIVEKILNIK